MTLSFHPSLRDRCRHHGARNRTGRAGRWAPVSLVDPQPDQRGSRTRRDRDAPRPTPPGDRRTNWTSACHICAVDQARPGTPDTVVIEAVLEDLAVKASVFAAGREALRRRECILATNTSSLSVTEIAAGPARRSRVVGMHFFNPVPVMRLVEVVTGLQTDPAVADTVADLAAAWGKDVARVKSAPGFIVNRVARAFYGEALRLVEEQVASPATIDEVMRAAGQFRMGPFELMDLIGNDVNAAVTRSVWTAFNFDPRFEPSRIQDELVSAGRYGRKTRPRLLLVRRGSWLRGARHRGVRGRAGLGDVETDPRPSSRRCSGAPAWSSSDPQVAVTRGGATLGDGTVLRVTRGRYCP